MNDRRIVQRGFVVGNGGFSVRREVVVLLTFADARSDLLTAFLELSFCPLNNRTEVCDERVNRGINAARRHTFRRACEDVRTRAGLLQAIQEIENGLQILKVFCTDVLALLNGGNNLANISGQLCHRPLIEIQAHAGVEYAQIGRFPVQDSRPKLIPSAPVLGLLIGLDALHGGINQVHRGRGQYSRSHAQRRGVDFLFFVNKRRYRVNRFFCAGDLRCNDDIVGLCAVLIHRDKRKRFFVHARSFRDADINLHAIFPILDPVLPKRRFPFRFGQAAQPDASGNGNVAVLVHEVLVGHVVVAGQVNRARNLNVERRVYIVARDLDFAFECGKQLCLVHAHCNCEFAYHALQIARQEQTGIHACSIRIGDHHAGQSLNLQAVRRCIWIRVSENKRLTRGLQSFFVRAFRQFDIFHDLCDDLIRRQFRDVGFPFNLPVRLDKGFCNFWFEQRQVCLLIAAQVVIGGNIGDDARRGQFLLACAFRDFDVFSNRRGHNGRLFLGFVTKRPRCDLCIRRNRRAGIRRKRFPCGLRAVQIQIGGDFQDFLRNGAVDHLIQRLNIGDILEIAEMLSDLRVEVKHLRDVGNINVWEQRLNFSVAHPGAFQQGHLRSDLCQKCHVLGECSLIHFTGQLVQLGKDVGAPLCVRLAGFGELCQQLVQPIQLVLGIPHIFLVQHMRHVSISRLQVLLRRCGALGFVLFVQRIQLILALRSVVNLDDFLVLGVVLVVHLLQHRRVALRGGEGGLLVQGRIHLLSHRGRARFRRANLLRNDVVCFRAALRLFGEAPFQQNFLLLIHQTLPERLVLIRQVFPLEVIQIHPDALVQRVQLGDGGVDFLRLRRVAAGLRLIPQLHHVRTGVLAQGVRGILPFLHDGVRLVLAVRPDLHHAVHPVLHSAGGFGCGLLEVLGIQPEEVKPLSAGIEGVRRGVLPVLGGLVHALQRFTGGLCAAGVVVQLVRAVDDRRRQPGHRQLGRPDNLQQASHAAARARDRRAELADGSHALAQRTGDIADHADNSAHDEQRRAHRGSGRAPLDDAQTLLLVQPHKLVQQVAGGAHKVVYHGGQVTCNLLSGERSLVLQIRQPRGGRRIDGVGLLGQRRVLVPCLGRVRDGVLQQPGGADGTQHGIAQAHFLEAQVLQRRDGGDALLVHLRKPLGKGDKRARRVAVPQVFEFLIGHPRDIRKVAHCIRTLRGCNFHLNQGFRERGAAHFGFDADGGQRRRDAQNLRFGQPDLLACTGKAHGHLHDGRFGRRVVIAQIGDGGTEPAHLFLGGTHDVDEFRNLRRAFIGGQVGRGIAEVDHRAGEGFDVLRRDAQLTGGGHDLVDVVRAHGERGGHLLRRGFQLRVFRLGRRDRLANLRKRLLKLDLRGHARSGNAHERGRNPPHHRAAGGNHRRGHGARLRGEARQRRARPRPRGALEVQLAGGVPQLRLGIVQRGVQLGELVLRLLDFLRVAGGLRRLELFLRRLHRVPELLHLLTEKRLLFLQQLELRRSARRLRAEVGDTRPGKAEFALRQLHLLAQRRNRRLIGGNRVPRRIEAVGRGRQLPICLTDFLLRGHIGGARVVQGGGVFLNRRPRLTDFLRVVFPLRRFELRLGGGERFLVPADGGLLKGQLAVEHLQLRRQRGRAFGGVFDASGRQRELALHRAHPQPQHGDGALVAFQHLRGLRPARTHGGDGAVAGVKRRLRVPHRRLRVIQFGRRGMHRIRCVLRRLFRRFKRPGQLLQFSRGRACPCRIESGLCLPLVLLALCQLFVRRNQRLLVLIHGDLLEIELARQHCLLRRQPFGRLLEIRDPGGGQLEGALRFLDVGVDGLDVPREVVRLQGQRNHKVSERFSHALPPPVLSAARLQIRPHLVDVARLRFFFLLLIAGVPCADFEEARHIHAVNLVHAPAALQKIVVGLVDVLRQRQVFVVSVSVAVGFVGNSDSTCVMFACTAISASAMSLIRRSAG